MRFFIFATIFLTVFALLNLYIVKRFVNKLDIQQKYKKVFKVFLLINFLGIIGYMYARYNPEIPNWLYFLLSLPIGVVFLIFSTAVIYDISRVVVEKTTLNKKRREFFKNSLDISSVAIAGALSARAIYEAKHIVVEDVKIKIKDLNKPYKIVQLSDVHIGGLIDEEFIKDLVKRVNQLNADVVVITGDLVDIALEYAKPALKQLQKLNSTFGTFFVAGNHEYLHGLDEILDHINSLGIKVLKNENVFIGKENEGFNLAGVYDVMGSRVNHHQPDIKKALQDKQDRPTVLLSHQPRFINSLDEKTLNKIDLILSGHTHGGQLYPFRILVKLVQPYIAGLYRHNDTTQIYVNKGTGYWGPPMRLAAMAEITNITLY